MILYIIIAILMFGLLIAVHEWGHYITAKRLGVQVNEFSIGMGPKIWSKQKGETLYSLRAFPIGGFCAMEGEDEDTDNPRAFVKKPVWKKLIILCAGSAMNLLVGFLIVLAITSINQVITVPVVSSLEPQFQSIGEEPLLPGDRFVSMDGRKVVTVSDVQTYLGIAQGKDMDIVVERGGEEVALGNVTLVPYSFTDDSGKEAWKYGINFTKVAPTPGLVLRQSIQTTGFYARSVWLSFQMLFQGEAGFNDLAGPVGIVSLIGESGTQAKNVTIGIQNVLSIIALVAVNLAIVNMLPIPALDGGRIFLILVNKAYFVVTRKNLNPKYETFLNGACLVLLMLLMVAVTFQDVWRLVS